jgi:hypothetical protein
MLAHLGSWGHERGMYYIKENCHFSIAPLASAKEELLPELLFYWNFAGLLGMSFRKTST